MAPRSHPDPRTNKTADSFLPLHPLELRILMILLEGPTHGYALVREIESGGDLPGRIYPANLYRRIRDLLAAGLVEDAEPPTGEEGDSRRRYFRVTGLGREVASAEALRLKRLLDEALARGLIAGPEGSRS